MTSGSLSELNSLTWPYSRLTVHVPARLVGSFKSASRRLDTGFGQGHIANTVKFSLAPLILDPAERVPRPSRKLEKKESAFPFSKTICSWRTTAGE